MHPYQDQIDKRAEQLKRWDELPQSERDRLIDELVDDVLIPPTPPVVTRVTVEVACWTPGGWQPCDKRARTFPGARSFRSGVTAGVEISRATHRLTWQREVFEVRGGKVDQDHPLNYRESVYQFIIMGGK